MLAVMDFGLGPSTLDLLRRRLLGELRIASPLVRGMTESPTDRHIVGALAVGVATGGIGAGVGYTDIDQAITAKADSGAINALFTHADRVRLIVNPILMPVLTVSGLTDVTTVEPG